MSYCRFSSDGFRCEVYVYEDVNGGWTTHVAAKKRLGLDTLPPDPYEILEHGIIPDGWADMHRAYHRALQSLPLAPIGLPHDGESFNDGSPGACSDRLEYLKGLGYHVPQYAIDALREEQEEINKKEEGR